MKDAVVAIERRVGPGYGLDIARRNTAERRGVATQRGQGDLVEAHASGEIAERLQPVVDEFFYWLRASRLETDRISYWWANRMLASERPRASSTEMAWRRAISVGTK